MRNRKVFTIGEVRDFAFFSLQSLFKRHDCPKEDLEVVIYLIRELYAIFELDPNYLLYSNHNGNTLFFFWNEGLVEFNAEKKYLRML